MERDKVYIGCDPEYTIYNYKWEFVSADTIPNLDTDGYRAVGEIRPIQNDTVRNCVKNIADEILSSARKIENALSSTEFKMCTQDTHYATGGHIHISGMTDNELNLLVRLMDIVIAFRSIRQLHSIAFKKRQEKGYGMMTDYRRAGHGGFEYRTLGSWWLNNPLIAETIFGMVFFLSEMIQNDADTLWAISNGFHIDAYHIEDYYNHLYFMSVKFLSRVKALNDEITMKYQKDISIFEQIFNNKNSKIDVIGDCIDINKWTLYCNL